MLRRTTLALAAVAVLPLAAVLWAQEASFTVIVRADHLETSIRRQLLADAFRGKATRWGDRQPIAPIDQSLRSSVRAAFSSEILGLSIDAVMSYWRKQLRSGRRRPPPVALSDEVVISYVASPPGAVGYISGDTETPESVKVLKVLE